MIKTYSLDPAVMTLNRIQNGFSRVIKELNTPSLTIPASRMHNVKCPSGFRVRYTPKNDGDKIDATVIPGVDQGNDDPFSEYSLNGTIFWCSIVDEPDIRNRGTYINFNIEATSEKKILKIEYLEDEKISEEEYAEISNKIDSISTSILQACELKPRPNYVLCLSGGGLRALFYHLGVVYFLNKSGSLKYVSKIFAVSGGSILAAHMLSHWHRYSGSPQEFEETANSLITTIAKTNIRGAVIRQDYIIFSLMAAVIFLLPPFVFSLLGFPWGIACAIAVMIGLSIAYYFWFFQWLRSSRIKRLRSIYNKIYSKITFKDASGGDSEHRQRAGKPEVHFLTTGLKTGAMVSFCDWQLVVSRPFDGSHDDDFGGNRIAPKVTKFGLTEGFQLADAVTASSAYPPLFPPLDIIKDSKQHFNEDDFIENDNPSRPDTFLSDGGVFDNLGLRSFSVSQEILSESVDFVFACDAGNPLSFRNEKPKDLIALSLRTIEILMDRISTLERISAAKSGAPIKNISIYKKAGNYPISESAQHTLGKVRTDLDAFSPAEVFGLISHGYNVAKKLAGNLVKDSDTESYSELWVPDYCKEFKLKQDDIPVAEQKSNIRNIIEPSIKKAAKRNLGLFSVANPLPLFATTLAVASPFFACYILYGSGATSLTTELRESLTLEASSYYREIMGEEKLKHDIERSEFQKTTSAQAEALRQATNNIKEEQTKKSDLERDIKANSLEITRLKQAISEYNDLPPDILSVIDKANGLDTPFIQKRSIMINDKGVDAFVKELSMKKKGQISDLSEYKRIYIWYLEGTQVSQLLFVGFDQGGDNSIISGYLRSEILKELDPQPQKWCKVKFQKNGTTHTAFVAQQGVTVSQQSSYP